MTRQRINDWISAMLAATPLRANSLIITVYGDAIAPHGGSVWLGSLIDLLAPLGFNSRAVRTSVFRLTQEAWLQATPVGRRSAYGLTSIGRRRISHAYRRIYDAPQEAWTGDWQLVIVPDGALPPRQRDELRRDLLWEGYGALAPGVFALPASDNGSLTELLQQSGCADAVVVLKGETLPSPPGASMRQLVDQCWHLGRLANDYRRFSDNFSPLAAWLTRPHETDPTAAFILRTLLIHEFRRIQLRDPQLPDALLATDWPGHTARALCRDLYEKTLAASERHLLATLSTPEGKLPAADAGFFQRFGGIRREGLTREAPGGHEAGKASSPQSGAPVRHHIKSKASS